jgi:uncharacterized protein
MKKTLVLGASSNPNRYSNIAIGRLIAAGHEVIAIGSKPGEVHGITIETSELPYNDVHTVSLYLNPVLQRQYYKYLLALRPKRIIFNPGTENAELSRMATSAGIHCENACTLVLLSTDQY